MNETLPPPTHEDLGGGKRGENQEQNEKRETKSEAGEWHGTQHRLYRPCSEAHATFLLQTCATFVNVTAAEDFKSTRLVTGFQHFAADAYLRRKVTLRHQSNPPTSSPCPLKKSQPSAVR